MRTQNTKLCEEKPGRNASGPESYIERLYHKFSRDSAKGPARKHGDLQEFSG